jgi:hypothetical protein
LRRLGIRLDAEGGHVVYAKFSPVGKNRREYGCDFIRSKSEKPMTRSTVEGTTQTLSQSRIKDRRVSQLD